MLRTPAAQLIVIGPGAGLVGITFDGNEVTLGVGVLAYELVQLLFGFVVSLSLLKPNGTTVSAWSL